MFRFPPPRAARRAFRPALAFIGALTLAALANADDSNSVSGNSRSPGDGAADQIVEGRDYFAILPGYAKPATSYGPDGTGHTTGAGATVSGIFGHLFTEHVGLEVNAQSSTFETGNLGGTDFYQNGGTVDLTYSLFPRREDRLLTPFVLAGVGGTYDDFYPKTLDGPAFIADAGLGVVSKPLFRDRLRLRVDARYVRDSKDGGHGEKRFLAGIEIPLGASIRHIEYIHEAAPPAPPPPPAPKAWADSDGDGVDDDHDRCPDTPHGLKVDAEGCALPDQMLELQGVTFQTNQASLTPNAQTILDLVSKAFVGQRSLTVEIAGHTDSRGSAALNLSLSQRRADTVRDYLISKGASPDQLLAKGYGKTQPLVSPEKNERDRTLNRRVELRLHPHEQPSSRAAAH